MLQVVLRFLSNFLQPHCSIGARVSAILRFDYCAGSTLVLSLGDEMSPERQTGTVPRAAARPQHRVDPGPDPTALAVIFAHGCQFGGMLPSLQEMQLGVTTIAGLLSFIKLLAPKRSQLPAEPEEERRPCGQCLVCVAACPSGALTYEGNVWRLDLSICLGCRYCLSACPRIN